MHHYEPTANGIFSGRFLFFSLSQNFLKFVSHWLIVHCSCSALPTACLWLSKIASSYLNTWLQERVGWEITFVSKVFSINMKLNKKFLKKSKFIKKKFQTSRKLKKNHNKFSKIKKISKIAKKIQPQTNAVAKRRWLRGFGAVHAGGDVSGRLAGPSGRPLPLPVDGLHGDAHARLPGRPRRHRSRLLR